MQALDSLPGVMRHLSDAWARRDEDTVLLVHFDDLLADIEGQMRRLAGLLSIKPPGAGWRRTCRGRNLGCHASAGGAPRANPNRILRDPRAFFRRGVSAQGPSYSIPLGCRATTTAQQPWRLRICSRGCTAEAANALPVSGALHGSCLSRLKSGRDLWRNRGGRRGGFDGRRLRRGQEVVGSRHTGRLPMIATSPSGNGWLPNDERMLACNPCCDSMAAPGTCR